MSKKKKLLVGLISTGAAVLAIVGIAFGVKKANAKIIAVIPVSSLQQEYYNYNESSISGEVTTHVTQKVNLENDSIVSEVYVKVGDKVKEGDKLLSYDMTLTELELQLEKLTRENNENKLKKAKDRLASLESGGPIDEDYEDDEGPSTGLEGDDEASLRGSSGLISVSAFRPMKVVSNEADEVTDAADNTQEEVPQIPGAGEEETTPPTESPAETPTEPQEESYSTAYAVLDFDSQPYAGTGTAQDPYRYLCDGTEEYITVQGSFLNKMAGYDAAGENKISQDGPFWYRLEFHENNIITDINNPQESLVGYYARKGGSEPSDASGEKRFSVEGAGMSEEGTQVVTPPASKDPDFNEDQELDGPEGDDGWDDDYDDDSAISREDAIKSQKNTVEELELAIKSNDIQISKLEKKLNNKVILSTIDGIVKVVGDPVTGESEGDAFIEIDSDDGLYVKGAISELELDDVTVGQTLSVFSYESGQTFQAEIKEISQFPASSNEYYMGMGNPNVSYYPFMAKVLDDPAISNGESVEMKLSKDESDKDGLYIDSAFVRTEEGQKFVYKDDKGRLVKQIVQATPTSDGYAIKIESGITTEDKIAFPYGKGVREGAKTKEGTLDEVYGYF